jgi:hypothetical protein
MEINLITKPIDTTRYNYVDNFGKSLPRVNVHEDQKLAQNSIQIFDTKREGSLYRGIRKSKILVF